VDFVTSVPACKSFEGITYENMLTVTDRLTKRCYAIPVSSMTAEATAHMFLRYIYADHGLPKTITSDRGPQFVSAFMQELCKLLGIEQRLSSSYHPQTNGQDERTNQKVEQYLRFFANYKQDNWVNLLPVAQFAINDSVNESIKMTPFMADYGHNPRALPSELTVTSPAPVGPHKMDVLKARAHAKEMTETLVKLRQNLASA
jgi:transposase InsO family protein